MRQTLKISVTNITSRFSQFPSIPVIVFLLSVFPSLIHLVLIIMITLFESVRIGDLHRVRLLLDSSPTPLNQIQDQSSSSLLHIAANNNHYDLTLMLLKLFNRSPSSVPINESLSESISTEMISTPTKLQWLNKRDNDGFTCLHYAVFRNNPKLAMRLQEEGADIFAINKQGLTVLHIAAQGDSPALIYYYLSKGFKLTSIDNKGSTAFHWACYSGSEYAVSSLLVLGCQIDKQDTTYGMTGLHLATMTGNSRVVRKLLVRGCNRNIKNYSNKTALNLAEENEYKIISSMIIDRSGIQQILNIKSPFRKVHIRAFPFYFLLFVFLTNYILNISFVFATHITQRVYLGLIFLFLGLITAILYLIVMNTSPGYISSSQEDYFNLLVNVPPSKICYDCKIIKPQRSKHCEICGVCIAVYDHHCPWVSNCIGANNYCTFYSFLLTIWIFMSYTIIFESFSNTQIYVDIQYLDWNEPNWLDIIRITCVFYGLLCSAIFFLPLTFLIYIQTQNMCLDQTTLQRYSTKPTQKQLDSISNNSVHSLSSSMVARNSQKPQEMDQLIKKRKAHIQNCMRMCYGNSKNSLYHIGTKI